MKDFTGTRLCQVPVVIDDEYKIRVLDPEQCKRTEQLAEDCKTFVDSELFLSCSCDAIPHLRFICHVSWRLGGR